MQLSASIGDYARSMAADCRIDSACAFISDKTAGTAKIYQLGNFGVNEEILDLYKRHGICDLDPFTDALAIERGHSQRDASFREPNHPQVTRCGERARDYWQFVSHQDIEVVGAATLTLQSRLYLTIGAHRSRGRHRSAVPVARLSHGIDILQQKIATNLLATLLNSGRGYRSLIEVLSPPSDPRPDALSALSARETEIARLVCQGKQNKEIAWVAKLSEYTVENHLRRIYHKLGIHNRAALVARVSGVLT